MNPNIILWHESDEIKKKGSFQNFSWFQFYLQVMYDYVRWHCRSVDYWFEISLVNKIFCGRWLLFYPEMMPVWFLCGTSWFLRVSLRIARKRLEKNWHFWECPLYKIWECVFNLKAYFHNSYWTLLYSIQAQTLFVSISFPYICPCPFLSSSFFFKKQYNISSTTFRQPTWCMLTTWSKNKA